MMNTKLFVTRTTGDMNAPATDGVAVTGANTYYSKMWTGTYADGYGLHVQWTGTPTGTLTLWYSDKENPSEANDDDWVEDTGFAPSNPAGAAGKFRDDATNARARRKRLKYVNAAGSGVLYAYVSVAQG